jgi:Bacterial PH domain
VRTSYRATFSTFGWLEWAAFLGITIGILVAWPRGLTASGHLGLVFAGISYEMFFAQLATWGITITPDGVQVRQPMSRRDLPWSLVADVAVDRSGRLTIRETSGRRTSVFGFGGSLIGMVTGGIQAKKVRDGILAARPVPAAAGAMGLAAAPMGVAVGMTGVAVGMTGVAAEPTGVAEQNGGGESVTRVRISWRLALVTGALLSAAALVGSMVHG